MAPAGLCETELYNLGFWYGGIFFIEIAKTYKLITTIHQHDDEDWKQNLKNNNYKFLNSQQALCDFWFESPTEQCRGLRVHCSKNTEYRRKK